MAYRCGDGDGGYTGYRADRGRDRRYDEYDRLGTSRAPEPEYDYSDENSSEDGRTRRYRRHKDDNRRSRYNDRQRDRSYDRGSRSYPQNPEKRRSYYPDYDEADDIDDIRNAGPRRLKSSDDFGGGHYEKNRNRYNGPNRYTKNEESQSRGGRKDNYPSSDESDQEFPEYNPGDYEYPVYAKVDRNRKKTKKDEDYRRRNERRNSRPYDNNLEDGIPEADYVNEMNVQKDDKGKGRKRKGPNRLQDDSSVGDRPSGRDEFIEDLPADYGSDSSSLDVKIGVATGAKTADKNHKQSKAIRDIDNQRKRLKPQESDDLVVDGTSDIILASRDGSHDNQGFELNERRDRRRTDSRQMGNSTSVEPNDGGGNYGQGHPSRSRGQISVDDVTSITIDNDDDASSTSSTMERRAVRPTTGLARKRLRRAGPLTENEELLAVMGDGKAAARLREHQRAELKDKKIRKHDEKRDIAKQYGDLYRQTIK